MSDYAKLVEDLKRGFGHWYVEDWSRLVSMYADAAAAIEALEARLGEAENSVERWKDMYLTKHEPKRGEWVGVSPMVDTVQCSVCGGQLFSAELETPYCPYCGAKMTEVRE